MKRNVIAGLCGFGGMAVAWLCYAAYIDHARVNALWDLAVQQANARAQMAQPMPQQAPAPQPTVEVKK